MLRSFPALGRMSRRPGEQPSHIIFKLRIQASSPSSLISTRNCTVPACCPAMAAGPCAPPLPPSDGRPLPPPLPMPLPLQAPVAAPATAASAGAGCAANASRDFASSRCMFSTRARELYMGRDSWGWAQLPSSSPCKQAGAGRHSQRDTEKPKNSRMPSFRGPSLHWLPGHCRWAINPQLTPSAYRLEGYCGVTQSVEHLASVATVRVACLKVRAGSLA